MFKKFNFSLQAPEVIEMEGAVPVSDIWSLACTILELYNGVPPFWALGPVPALFAMVDNPHPPLTEGISAALSDFLLSCFERDVTKRATAVGLLGHLWITQNPNVTKKIFFLIINFFFFFFSFPPTRIKSKV